MKHHQWRRHPARKPQVSREGNVTVLFTPGKRNTPHWKKYVIDWRTWYIFLWLVTLTVHRHPAPFNKTEAGRKRRAERRFVRKDKECNISS